MAENINTAPTQTLADGGYFLTFSQPATTVTLKRLSVATVDAAVTKANSALQPASVRGMAYEDPADWVSLEDYDTMVAMFTAQIANLQSQIDDLNQMVGTETIQVFEPNVYVAEVYVG